MRTVGYFGGCCGNCKWKDWGARCSLAREAPGDGGGEKIEATEMEECDDSPNGTLVTAYESIRRRVGRMGGKRVSRRQGGGASRRRTAATSAKAGGEERS